MAILKYAFARIVVLLAVAGVLYLAGARSWLMWLGALLLAAMVSYVALPGIRNEAAGSLARQDDRRTRVDHDADEEDAMLDSDSDSEAGGFDGDGDGTIDGETFVEHAPAEPEATAQGASADGSVTADAAAEEADGSSSLERVPDAVADAPTHTDSEAREDARER